MSMSNSCLSCPASLLCLTDDIVLIYPCKRCGRIEAIQRRQNTEAPVKLYVSNDCPYPLYVAKGVFPYNKDDDAVNYCLDCYYSKGVFVGDDIEGG